jgi:hypothetical protein
LDALSIVKRAEVVDIPTTSPAAPTPKDSSTKTWAEFYKMIEVEALTATEAQKKENIDTRTKQIEQRL